MKWVYGNLANDATLTGLGCQGVHRGNAPAGAAHPFARFTHEYTRPTRGNGGLHVLSVVGVRVVFMDESNGADPGRSIEGLRPLHERAIALLDSATDYTAELEVASSTLVEEVEDAGTEDGIDWRYIGGIYEVIARST
jgi:hypothetical protein